MRQIFDDGFLPVCEAVAGWAADAAAAAAAACRSRFPSSSTIFFSIKYLKATNISHES